MKRRTILLLVAGVCLLGGVYAASPYWAVHEIQAAARAGDGATVLSYFDVSSVRDNLKTQLDARMSEEPNGGFSSNGLAASMEMAVLPRLEEAAINEIFAPEKINDLVLYGESKPETGHRQVVTTDMSYLSPNRFLVQISIGDNTPTRLILARENLLGWTVKGITPSRLASAR